MKKLFLLSILLLPAISAEAAPKAAKQQFHAQSRKKSVGWLAALNYLIWGADPDGESIVWGT